MGGVSTIYVAKRGQSSPSGPGGAGFDGNSTPKYRLPPLPPCTLRGIAAALGEPSRVPGLATGACRDAEAGKVASVSKVVDGNEC